MAKYFVTGAMGFVGSHWCEYLLSKDNEVIGLDLHNNYPQLLDHHNFTFLQESVTNYDLIRTIINRVDYVCHFASIAEPDQYITNTRKVIDIAGIAALRIVALCRMMGKKIFFTSTSEVYGKNPDIPFHEDDDRVLGSTATRRWCYSSSKALVEHYLHACSFNNELQHVTVRLFNVYGPRLKGRVVSNYIEKAYKGENLILHGSGSETRSFTYIDDVMEAFDLLLHSEDCINQVFNIGNPVETNIRELAETVISICNTSSEIESMDHEEYYGKSYEGIDRRVPSIEKITKMTGWKPKTSLDQGIQKMFSYYKSVQNDQDNEKEILLR